MYTVAILITNYLKTKAFYIQFTKFKVTVRRSHDIANSVLNDSINIPLYIQLYTYIKDSILNNDISPGERLPSLRALSKTLNLSLTTIELAYNQLLVEGYISSKPQSGYYVNDISSEVGKAFVIEDSKENRD